MRSRGLLMATEALSLSDGCKPTRYTYTYILLRDDHMAVFILACISASVNNGPRHSRGQLMTESLI